MTEGSGTCHWSKEAERSLGVRSRMGRIDGGGRGGRGGRVSGIEKETRGIEEEAAEERSEEEWEARKRE
jgi:hypothetical protein